MRCFKVILLGLVVLAGTALPALALGSEWETLNARALRLYRQGQHKRAIKVAQEALQIAQNERLDHPAVALSLHNLGLLHKQAGNYADAEAAYLFALSLGEKARGRDHLSVAKTLNNLAVLYEAQERYDKALSHYRRALAIKERDLGYNHLSVALSVNNLASLYRKLGHYSQAEAHYQQALGIRLRALGNHHPLVLESRRDIAALRAAAIR